MSLPKATQGFLSVYLLPRGGQGGNFWVRLPRWYISVLSPLESCLGRYLGACLFQCDPLIELYPRPSSCQLRDLQRTPVETPTRRLLPFPTGQLRLEKPSGQLDLGRAPSCDSTLRLKWAQLPQSLLRTILKTCQRRAKAALAPHLIGKFQHRGCICLTYSGSRLVLL